MNYKKILVLIIIIILVAVGINFFLQEKTAEAPLISNDDEMLIGGDQDEHGCIASAGYLWCEAKGECLRPWEDEWDETCDTEEFSFEKDATVVPEDGSELVACTMEAKICPDGSTVGRVAPDCEFEPCPIENIE